MRAAVERLAVFGGGAGEIPLILARETQRMVQTGKTRGAEGAGAFAGPGRVRLLQQVRGLGDARPLARQAGILVAVAAPLGLEPLTFDPIGWLAAGWSAVGRIVSAVGGRA